MNRDEHRAMRAVWYRYREEFERAVAVAHAEAEVRGFPLIAAKLDAVRFDVAEDSDSYSHLARESHEVEKLKGMFFLIGQPGMEGCHEHAVPVFKSLIGVSDVIARIDGEMHETIARLGQLEAVFA